MTCLFGEDRSANDQSTENEPQTETNCWKALIWLWDIFKERCVPVFFEILDLMSDWQVLRSFWSVVPWLAALFLPTVVLSFVDVIW